jgi:hypothetical protein
MYHLLRVVLLCSLRKRREEGDRLGKHHEGYVIIKSPKKTETSEKKRVIHGAVPLYTAGVTFLIEAHKTGCLCLEYCQEYFGL